MKRIFVCLALAGLAIPAAATVSEAQVDEFVKSNSYWDELERAEKAELYRALRDAPAGSKVDSAAAALAAKWRVDKSVAADLIEATLLFEEFAMFEETQRHAERAVGLLHAATRAAPQSPEVWNLAVELLADQGVCGDQKFRDEYLARPFAELRFIEMDECENWLPEFVRLYPRGAAGRIALTQFLKDRDPASAAAMARWTLDSVQTNSVAELALRRQYWEFLGRYGLGETLLEDAARVGDAERETVLHEIPTTAASVPGYDFAHPKYGEQLRQNALEQWLAALIAANRLAEARVELAREKKNPFGYLSDAASEKFNGDIYERYVGDGDKGLLWKARQQGVTVSRVTAKFLAANQMESAAATLRRQVCHPYVDDGNWPEFDRELARLPEEFQAYRKRHSDALKRARLSAGCQERGGGKMAVSSQLPHYAEVPLTVQQKAAPIRAPYKGRIPLPRSFELVRAERDGDEIRAICISPAVDPGGEVSQGGYWLLRSRDGGANWDHPYYLGLQSQSPYVVAPEARMSMFAPGVLRLEAEVAELDPESITFPPVGLSLRREAKNLYIDIPLETIERDSDGDGLTDLLEAKLATDPANADTDGDGLSDRFDDFPQASARAEPSDLAPIVVDVLKKLTGYELAGIIEPVRRQGDETKFLTGWKRADAGSVLFCFIEGDAREFAGLRVDGQVIVVNAEQIAAISARSGPFYPLSFPAIIVDPQRTRALVQWSAGWTGGTINYQKKNGRWIGKQGAQWITRRAPIISTLRISPG